ncbi:hypothetical protein SAMN04488544_1619 [Microlunatus sagamiharensis]|uniref:Tryptophan-associated transmembrane protein (Trp_oprn_chp) n=1 Tax=Microlunatus sagamiharensis TaxID=546874 RepID=A0A1H2M9C6_9ACTN|nr:hypothetical protein [Microlunatus sagamiharensis]SDU89714.1 hypothetical protein SAMN04488544_1619 [Microlunatus sagamiharensis]
MPARFSSTRGSARPTGVRAALVVAVLGVLLVLGAVLAPVLGTIGSADAASAGALDVPVGRIILVGVLGLLVVLALGVGLFRTWSTPVAWALAVVAVLVTLVVSLYPLLVAADAALQQGRAFVPWVTGLVARLRG